MQELHWNDIPVPVHSVVSDRCRMELHIMSLDTFMAAITTINNLTIWQLLLNSFKDYIVGNIVLFVESEGSAVSDGIMDSDLVE